MKTLKLLPSILLLSSSFNLTQGKRVVRDVIEGSGDFEEEFEDTNTKILSVDNILEENAQKVNDEEVTTTESQPSPKPKDVSDTMPPTEENEDVTEMEMNSAENTDIDSYEETWNQISDNIVKTDIEGDIFEQQKCHKCLRTIWQANHKEFCNQCENRNIIELGRQRKQLKERCSKCDRDKFKERHLLFCQDSCNDIENVIIEEDTMEKESSLKKNKNKERKRKDKIKNKKNKNKEATEDKKNPKDNEEGVKKVVKHMEKVDKHKNTKAQSQVKKKPDTKEKKTKSQEKDKAKKKLKKNKKKNATKQATIDTNETDKIELENEVIPVNNEAELGTIGKLIQYWISRNTPGLEG